ncbi:hypothetical protein SMKI_13G1310 [Saccharomyces mikatae IFO 1815]|uniref:SAP domain-containing protein n=1 Tax=Saccharomyces mikatae IFO 1815 TaxID=226126 RepID=A0AA35IRC8_SACMI|nr:uncharacterized protein SMKI_13G1310 [Saccharomyces mikatae IFO 1815]CAI4035482.1 hypothetical protein SMKI_13G1310 [Saccharomyces mikatae IFO 1815]
MSSSILGIIGSRKSLGILTVGLGRSVSLPCTFLLKRSEAFGVSLHRYVHSTQTKSHLIFLMKNNDMTPFQRFTVKVLKEQCKSRGLKISGRKSDLLQRLITYDSYSHTKRSIKVDGGRKDTLINERIKIDRSLLPEKMSKTIEKKYSSVQKLPDVQPPYEVHLHLQPRDRIFLIGFFMLSCIWWNLETQESEPTISR